MKTGYPTSWQANKTLIILLISYIVSMLDRQILTLLVEPIRRDLAITDFQISLLQGMAFAFLYAILGIPIGRLADRRSRKVIIAWGVFLWSLMTISCGFARHFGTLFLARAGVGVGEATLSPSAYSLLSDTFPPARLARAAAIFMTGGTIGGGISYIIGGAIINLVSEISVLSLPIIGVVKPWQLVFMIVGLPGFLISVFVLAITEPERKGVLRSAQTASDKTPITEVFRYIFLHRRTYGSIVFSVSLLTLYSYGYLNWYPTFLMRVHNLTAGQVGLWFGIISMVFTPAGALAGAFTSELFQKYEYKDGILRTIIVIALALVPLALGPLAPNVTLALVICAPTMFFLGSHYGIAMAAIQLITPNQMRATISAIFLFTTTLIGLGVGASLVAFFTDYVFGNDLAVGSSLVLVGLITAPLGAVIAWKGLSSYRATLVEASYWQE